MSNITTDSNMTYQTGTMFRMYNSDKSKHYTGVLLNDGKVLEVKNPDGMRATKFENVDEFKAARQMEGGELVVSTATANGVPISKGTHGFKYPNTHNGENMSWFIWPRWLYSILLEIAPHYLAREDVRDAYNTLVEALEASTKHDIHSYDSVGNNKYTRYSKSYFAWTEEIEFKGYPLTLYSYSDKYTTQSKKLKYEEIRATILKPYKQLYDIIHEELFALMETKDKIAKIEGEINNKLKHMRVVNRRILRLENKAKEWDKYAMNIGWETIRMRDEINRLKGVEQE